MASNTIEEVLLIEEPRTTVHCDLYNNMFSLNGFCHKHINAVNELVHKRINTIWKIPPYEKLLLISFHTAADGAFSKSSPSTVQSALEVS